MLEMPKTLGVFGEIDPHDEGIRFIALNKQNTDVYPLLDQVDAVISDPPYGAKVHAKGRHARDKEGVVTIEAIPFAQLEQSDQDQYATFAKRACRTWAITCCDINQVQGWIDTAALHDVPCGVPMVWVKPDAKPNFSGNGPAMGYEMMLPFWCGEGPRKWNGGGRTGVFTHVKRHTGSHPTEKPLPLMRELVTLFTNPGDIVFDPFMGSGSTGVACLELGRRFIGCERDPTYYATACKRLAAAAQVVPLYAEKAKPVALFEGEKAYATRGKKVKA